MERERDEPRGQEVPLLDRCLTDLGSVIDGAVCLNELRLVIDDIGLCHYGQGILLIYLFLQVKIEVK